MRIQFAPQVHITDDASIGAISRRRLHLCSLFRGLISFYSCGTFVKGVYTLCYIKGTFTNFFLHFFLAFLNLSIIGQLFNHLKIDWLQKSSPNSLPYTCTSLYNQCMTGTKKDTQINIRISTDLLEALRRMAEDEVTTTSQLVRKAVTRMVREHGDNRV